MEGQAYMEEKCWKLCSSLQTATETNSFSSSSTEPVVYSQLYSALERTLEKTPLSPARGPDFLRKSVASDMLDHMIAGYESSGIALAYTMYELCMHPEYQTSLRAELRSVDPPLMFPISAKDNAFSASSSPSALPKALDSLPLLNAALYETLRLYPPGAAGQPRVVPPGGAVLCGYPLPEGVVAHAAAYSVHRNEEVFERAEEWLPERWMGEKKEEVKNWFWAFGSGSRGCTGKEFALQGEPFILIIYFTPPGSSLPLGPSFCFCVGGIIDSAIRIKVNFVQKCSFSWQRCTRISVLTLWMRKESSLWMNLLPHRVVGS
jgi:unspecific monooxygenase